MECALHATSFFLLSNIFVYLTSIYNVYLTSAIEVRSPVSISSSESDMAQWEQFYLKYSGSTMPSTALLTSCSICATYSIILWEIVI